MNRYVSISGSKRTPDLRHIIEHLIFSYQVLFLCLGNPAEDCANNGFELWGSACYLFVGDQAKTQGSAYQACKQAWQVIS